MDSVKIAVPLAEGRLTTHFGHCASFALLVVDKAAGTIISHEDLVPPMHEPGVLPRWLGEMGVNLIIAGGMGSRAQALFTKNGIDVVTGAPCLTPEELAAQWIAGILVSGENGCDH
jgi:predicted Fe-Mo cluster-binding NifX family protein